jgi:hypothetical protein
MMLITYSCSSGSCFGALLLNHQGVKCSRVLKIGIASRLHRAPNKYAHFLPGTLTSFFIGKNVRRALSQVLLNELKKHCRCTKKWTKRDVNKIAPESHV